MIAKVDTNNVYNYNKENIVDTMKNNKEIWEENIGINNIYFQTMINNQGDNNGRVNNESSGNI